MGGRGREYLRGQREYLRKVPKACKGKGFHNVELKAYVLFESSLNQNRSLKVSH